MQRKLLEEKDFIHENYGKNPFRFWAWFATVFLVALLFFGAARFYFSTLAEIYLENPFLQVTNREMSLFLWQNPQHMRIHAKYKNGYLPAFEYAERIGLTPQYADDYAIAPPELFFLYHTWKRLLGDYFVPRAIPANEFLTFLIAAPEWTPDYWKDASENYKELLSTLGNENNKNLADLSFEVFPLEIRQAFIGWKNYFYESDQINAIQPTSQLLDKLLMDYPNYSRNYWCNIIGGSYLKSTYRSTDEIIKSAELSSFLRVALFNLEKSNSKK